jgi:hypothetical protein
VTPSEFVRYLEGVSQRLVPEIERAERASLEDLRSEAVALSQGPLQEADLAALGHPYSRRRGARLNPNIINRRTGDFQAAWEMEGTEWQGGELVGYVHNTDPKAPGLEAGLVFGKPLMVPRRPNEEAGERVEPRREQRLAEAIGRAFAE